MARSNDPFYSGQGSQLVGAIWFTDLHRKVGQRRLHIRFLFYVATGEEPNPETGLSEPMLLPDGTRCEKTAENWDWFQKVSKWAKNMELVDPALIVDKRRYHASLHTSPDLEPSVEITPPDITLPNGRSPTADVRQASGTVYGYLEAYPRHPSIVEIWVEKDLDEADNPVVESVCRSLGVNLITGTGFMTISAIHALLERRAELDKSLRILYLSDFDDAGEHMPVGPARHIEFALRNMHPRPDIRLHHLALTAEQVQDKNIPRKIPTKAEEEKIARLKNWEGRRGLGTVELNALTHPTRSDWFAELLRRNIISLRDNTIDRKIREAHREANTLVDEELTRRMNWPQRALELIAEQAEAAVEPYQEEREELERQRRELQRKISDLDQRIEAALEPLEGRAERVRQVAQLRGEQLEEELELPEIIPEESPGVTEGWLYDSRRKYFEQLERYKLHKV